MKEKQEVRFEPRKIYLKDVSFESPQSPAVFTVPEISPTIDVKLGLRHTALENDFTEVVLEVTCTSTFEEKTVFLVEVQQAGIFHIAGAEGDQLRLIKEVGCPNILLPFAREAIASLVAKGGFPQLLLNPINFEAMYAQNLEREAQAAQTPSSDAIN